MKVINSVYTIRQLLELGAMVHLYNGEKVLTLNMKEDSDGMCDVSYCEDYSEDTGGYDTEFLTLPWKACGLDVKDMLNNFITEDTELEIA